MVTIEESGGGGDIDFKDVVVPKILTTIVQLKLSNLPTSCTLNSLKIDLKQINLPFSGLRKPAEKDFAFLDVSSTAKEFCMELLEQSGYHHVSVAQERPRQKRQLEEGEVDGKEDKKKRTRSDRRRDKLIQKDYDGGRDAWKRLNDKVTPFWELDYSQQIQRKSDALKKLLGEFDEQLRLKSSSKNVSIDANETFEGVLECPEEGRSGYRNKCEFSLSLSPSPITSIPLPVLGFQLSSYATSSNPSTSVVSPERCTHVSPVHKRWVERIEKYIRGSRDRGLGVWNRVMKEGFWRLVVLRGGAGASSSGLLILIQSSHQVMLVSKQQLEDEKKMFVEFVKEFDKEGQISVFWQIHNGVHNGVSDNPNELLFGPGIIHEKLRNNEYTFQVSPESFFQSNTPACEVLYAKIHEWVANSKGTGEAVATVTKDSINKDSGTRKSQVVLDLCSGTGTIGITMSHVSSVKQIIGIEIVESAIRDAVINAKLNHIPVSTSLADESDLEAPANLDQSAKSVECDGDAKLVYHCGKVEELLPQVLQTLAQSLNLEETEIIAILDPPRAGVHKSLIASLRSCSFLSRVVYVSCSPKAAMQNWVDLCRVVDSGKEVKEGKSKVKLRGLGFELKRCVGVDLFPDTDHCELILDFRKRRPVFGEHEDNAVQ